MLTRLLAICVLAAALAASEPGPMLAIPRLAQPPLIDGRIADGEWDGAAATTAFASHDLAWAVAPPFLQSVLSLAWDEHNLYLALRTPQGGGDPRARAWQADDPAIAQDEHLEWLILPSADRSLARRDAGGPFRLLVNPRGAVLDQRMDGSRPGVTFPWQSSAEVGTGLQDGAWIVEVRLPAASLGARPEAGTAWIMQVLRHGADQSLLCAMAPGTSMEYHRYPEVVFTAGGAALQLLGLESTRDGLELTCALGAPATAPVEAIARLRMPDDGQTIERRLSAAAGTRSATTLRCDGLAAGADVRLFELTVTAGDHLLGRWDWRCYPADDPEIADLREQQDRQRQAGGLLGTLAELARVGQPIARRVNRSLERLDLAGAEHAARELVAALPWAPEAHRLLAGVLVRGGRTDAALDALEAAVRTGDSDGERWDHDPVFAALRSHPRWTVLRERLRASPGLLPQRPAVAVPAGRRAMVDDRNVAWDPLARQVVAHWLPAAVRHGVPISTASDETAGRLRAWWDEGTAAGNAGDLYDNRDGGHSHMREGDFPQSAWIRYRLAARDADLSEGLPEDLRHQGRVVVVGNASQAEVVGPFRRSLARRALTQPRLSAQLLWQYANNQIYAYPACFDFMKATERNGLGDVFPALTPYLITSFGYSGTDQACLSAVFTTLAAFRPEVKQHLIDKGLIAPTVQMILRRCLAGIETDADYLTARAHPAAFAGQNLRPGRMAELAHGLTLASLPPTVRLRVLEEDAPALPDRDFFDAPGRSEVLLDTPAAIARVMRSARKRSWRLVVGAEAGPGAEGRPLTLKWAVLRGTAELAIQGDGAAATITVPWQERHPAGDGSGLETDRIDVVCAAHDGLHWSAPAFVSFYAPAHETRTYHPDGRIDSVVYTGAEETAPYTDPLICTPKSWRDDYRWDGQGDLLGWTRTRGAVREDFAAEGRLVRSEDPGRKPGRMTYRVSNGKLGPMLVGDPAP